MLAWKRKIRLFWLILLGLILIFCVYQTVSPTGSWTCHQDFSAPAARLKGQSCLGLPSQAERVAAGQHNPLLMLADPIYFSVFSPRAFTKAEVEIIYRPHLSSSTPIFESGFLADKKLWRYRLEPVYNIWLEQGFSGWPELTAGQLHLFQRQARFSSVDEFLKAWREQGTRLCATKNCLAVYNISLADFPPALDLNSLSQESGETVFPYTLRGAHQFYFYLPTAGLHLAGAIIDRNENKDRDAAEVLIFSGQRQVASFDFPDNRNQREESGDISSPQAFQISRSDLPAGLYRLELRANDDLLFSGLKINSLQFAAINKLAVIGQEPVDLITDAPYLQIKTWDPASLQTISFGGTDLKIKEIYHQYEIKSQRPGWQKISSPRGGLILENSGVLAATPAALINPDYPRLDRFAPLSEQLDFVLADYQPAQILTDGWLRTKLEFDAAGLYREKNRYSLIFSVPGLQLDNGAGGFVEIKEINLHFSGKNLLTKLKEIIFKK